MVTEPSRACPSFALTDNSTAPLPFTASLLTAIHPSIARACQLQPFIAVTPMRAFPPAPSTSTRAV
jgi:hypothetical protein